MRVLAVTVALCGVFVLRAQQLPVAQEQREMPTPPPLPVITSLVLPGEGWAPGPYRLSKPATVFQTWKSPHVVLARLPGGSSVTLLSGLNRVDKPDLIEVTASIPELSLSRGDTILRYTERGEGNADFWAKGRWYVNGDLGWVRNADGSGCQRQCKAQEKKAGRSTWWFKIRLADGSIGWTKSLESPNM